MNEDEIYAKLTVIFREIFDDDAIVLSSETTATDIPDWDSFNHINLVVSAEAEFGIKFRSAEVEELKNVGEFVALIKSRLSDG